MLNHLGSLYKQSQTLHVNQGLILLTKTDSITQQTSSWLFRGPVASADVTLTEEHYKFKEPLVESVDHKYRTDIEFYNPVIFSGAFTLENDITSSVLDALGVGQDSVRVVVYEAVRKALWNC